MWISTRFETKQCNFTLWVIIQRAKPNFSATIQWTSSFLGYQMYEVCTLLTKLSDRNFPIEMQNLFKVIRHVFGFGIEFLENEDIGMVGHFMVIDFITRYSSHTYFSPISTSWYRRFGSGCIVRNGEWPIFVNYSVFSALFSLKLRILFDEGILVTPVQKDAVPPIVISNYHRWKPNSTKTDLCIELSLFTSH